MASAIEIFIEATKPTIVDQLVVPPRAERRLPIPGRYTSGGTGAYLTAKFGQCETLYRHQSLALRKIAQGRNVVISTATASGKTEAFQTPVIHEMLEGDGTVIVVQPMKALSGDQHARWKAAFAHARVSPDLVGEINGDVPIHDREEILERARIILITATTRQCGKRIRAPPISTIGAAIACSNGARPATRT